MLLALSVSALVALALLFDILAPRVGRAVGAPSAPDAASSVTPMLDPGRERRAEQTARELLRSCVGEEDWAMYRELGFIRVWGSQATARIGGAGARLPDLSASADRRLRTADRTSDRRVLRRIP